MATKIIHPMYVESNGALVDNTEVPDILKLTAEVKNKIYIIGRRFAEGI